MDYRTAAALSQNIAGIGDMFMQINDPATRARAALMGNQNALLGAQVRGQDIENQYRPGMFAAQTDAYRGSAANAFAGARYEDSRAQGQGIQNKAGQALLDGFMQVPTTSYSQGGTAGPDEMTDPWTEKGYSATGKNLSPGVVAVNPSVHPLGTVFQGQDGKTYIAADKHGNKDPNVVDIYRLPQEYQAQSGPQNLRVVGREKIPYGTTADQLAAMRAKYERDAALSNIFAGGGAADLATGTAKMAALNAPDEMAARRALAAQGVAMNQGEYFDPGMSDAFQGRALQGDLNQEALRQQGAMDRTAADNDLKARISVFDAMTAGGGTTAGSSTGGRGRFNAFDGAKEIGGATVARFALDGATVSQEDLPKAQAWATSVSTLTSQGVPFETAKAIADAHHGLPTMEDGWFSSPRQNYGAFNATAITPEQAAETAARYGVGGSGAAGPDMQRIMSAAQVFGYGGGQQQPAAQPQPRPPGQPADPVPQTGADKPARASDAFKPLEGKNDKKDRETREKRARQIESEIKTITSRLKTKTVSSGGVAGAYGFNSQASPTSRPMDNDEYNANLAKLQKLEGDLATLKSPAKATTNGVRKYNPATGTIE